MRRIPPYRFLPTEAELIPRPRHAHAVGADQMQKQSLERLPLRLLTEKPDDLFRDGDLECFEFLFHGDNILPGAAKNERVCDSAFRRINSPDDRATGNKSMSDAAFEHPRLAAIYDTMNTSRDDTDFYVALASRVGAGAILDIGCGTGLIACELARRGHRVTGCDPAEAMLEIARWRPHGRQVRWLSGDASALPEEGADLAIMTGHVAQVFLDDTSWLSTLTAVNGALRDGGRIAFEFRNPDARAWTRWNPTDSYTTLVHPTDGPVEAWVETLDVTGELVTFEWHYQFQRTNESLRSVSTLRFPDRATIEASLFRAGFVLETLYGDWDISPFEKSSPEMIFIATRGEASIP